MKRIKDSKYRFRQGVAKKPSEKRIEKVKGRKLASFHYLLAYATLPWNHYGFKPVFSFVFGPVVTKFFLPQYLQKMHLAHYPVKHVDHQLDEKVPFKPDHLYIYLDFLNIWIRPISMLIKRFGLINGSKLGGEFLKYINYCYHEAFKMYSISMTTTYRPRCALPSIKRIRSVTHTLCAYQAFTLQSFACASVSTECFLKEKVSRRKKKTYGTANSLVVQ